MGKGSSGAHRKKVDRAGFFRWGADSIRRMGSEFVDSLIEHMGESHDTAELLRLADEKTLGLKPRLYFAKGIPFFLLNDEEKNIIAFSAACPEEGGLLEWREKQQSFCCPFCQSAYNREGRSLRTPDISLIKHKVQIIDGQVWVRKTTGGVNKVHGTDKIS